MCENIKFDDWKKIDMRVGQIKAVKDHPKADKLYILLIDLGKEDQDRQVVAGLKGSYSEEELIGKKVIVFSNLEPAVLRGEESAGMILAAVKDDKVVLIGPENDIELGAKVE